MRTSAFGEVAAKLGFLSGRGTSFAWAPKSGTIVRLLFASDGGCSSVVEHLIVVQDVASSNLVSHPDARERNGRGAAKARHEKAARHLPLRLRGAQAAVKTVGCKHPDLADKTREGAPRNGGLQAPGLSSTRALKITTATSRRENGGLQAPGPSDKTREGAQAAQRIASTQTKPTEPRVSNPRSGLQAPRLSSTLTTDKVHERPISLHSHTIL